MDWFTGLYFFEIQENQKIEIVKILELGVVPGKLLERFDGFFQFTLIRNGKLK